MSYVLCQNGDMADDLERSLTLIITNYPFNICINFQSSSE